MNPNEVPSDTGIAVLTGPQFQELVHENPYWVRDVHEPTGKRLVINTFANLKGSPIAYLSKCVYFIGRDSFKKVADLSECPNLTVARGTFYGSVNFKNSGIREIDVEQLKIKTSDDNNLAASFEGCKNLTVATGEYPGRVSFRDSGVRTIHEFFIARIELKPGVPSVTKADFVGCKLSRVPKEVLFSRNMLIDPAVRIDLTRSIQAREFFQKEKQNPPFEL